MSVSLLAILLGLLVAASQAYGWLYPEHYRKVLQHFPRSVSPGYLLMVTATIWFLYNVNQETIADFAKYKQLMVFGFAGLGVMTCLFVQDFLAVRGLALVMLLLAKLMLDTARWAPTEWRLVIIVWAYIFILAGMWLTISPWRLRDWLYWWTASNRRIRTVCGGLTGFGLFVVGLGLTVF